MQNPSFVVRRFLLRIPSDALAVLAVILFLGAPTAFSSDEIDMTEMDEAVDEMSKVLEEIEDKIKTAFTSMEGGPGETIEDLGEVDDDAVPQKVMDRIERLFLQVGHATSPDLAMAARLKEELDKWNLYGIYEDRFLNLFRDVEGNL